MNTPQGLHPGHPPFPRGIGVVVCNSAPSASLNFIRIPSRGYFGGFPGQPAPPRNASQNFPCLRHKLITTRARRQADQRFNSGKSEGREGGLEGADRPGKDLTQSTMTFLSECNLDAEDFEALPEDVQGDIMEEKGRRTSMARSMNTQRRPPREDQPTRMASSYTAGANRSAKAMVSMEEWEGFG